MKITYATWEKRNLGVETTEFDIDLNDDVEIIDDILKNERHYNVARVPAGNTNILFALQKNGYIFTENMVGISITAKTFKALDVPNPQLRLVNALSYSKMSESDIDVLFTELQCGIFFNDRISRDAFFGEALAAKRYIGFTKDILASGGEAFNIIYKDRAIGFFINKKKKNGECAGSLFGMYSQWKKSGLGIAGVYMSLKEAFESGATVFTGNVSSNNLDQFKLDLTVGFSITHINYILTKHSVYKEEC
jgi:hypothetical protein